MYKELNFKHEAENLKLVGANLKRANVEAVVPAPFPGLVGVRAFAMTYEEGFKVTDVEALAMHAVDKEGLMSRIVQVYALCIYTCIYIHIYAYIRTYTYTYIHIVQVYARSRAHLLTYLLLTSCRSTRSSSSSTGSSMQIPMQATSSCK